MSDYTPVSIPRGLVFSSTASATITGGQLVTASGNGTVAPSTTGDHSVGVAAHDAPSGGRVTCYPLSGAIHELPIQGVTTIAAGAPILAGTTGTIQSSGTLAAAATAGTLLGIALVGGTGAVGPPVGKARFMGIA